jgi:hypothetical protein
MEIRGCNGRDELTAVSGEIVYLLRLGMQ